MSPRTALRSPLDARDIVDDLVAEKMKRNPSATSPGHLDSIVWNEIKDDKDTLRSFVIDAVQVAYQRIVARERATTPAAPVRTGSPHLRVAPLPTPATRTTAPSPDRAPARAHAKEQVNKLFGILENYHWPNGKALLEPTLREVGQFSGWGQAILRAAPKHAKDTDTLGKHFTADELFKLRTWDTASR